MNEQEKIFGPILTVLGVVVILYASVAFLSDGKVVLGLSVSQSESVVPFIVGLLFFLAGLSLIRKNFPIDHNGQNKTNI